MTNYNYIFNQFPRLETERLVLREFQESDVRNFYNMCLHEDYIEEFCSEGTYISLEDAYNSITWKYKQSFNSKEDLTWAIVLKESGELIGSRDLFVDSPIAPIITQGYIAPNHRNKGYNQEVLACIISFLKQANAEELVINCSVNNQPVLHIAEKLGFDDISTFQMKMFKNRCKFRSNIQEF
jgi:ribosomal-protein-alanine N-acetyltransferase